MDSGDIRILPKTRLKIRVSFECQVGKKIIILSKKGLGWIWDDFSTVHWITFQENIGLYGIFKQKNFKIGLWMSKKG